MPANRSYIILLFAFSSFIFISCNNTDTLFTSLSSSKTNIDFENNLQDRNGLGILNYIYYYNGGGVAIGDINNDGLPDIYFTANSHGGNKLYLNKGNFKFEDITEKAGVAGTSDWCTGVTMADVNGDGLLDIYVCAIAIFMVYKDTMNCLLIMAMTHLLKVQRNMDWIFQALQHRLFFLIMIMMVIWIVLT